MGPVTDNNEEEDTLPAPGLGADMRAPPWLTSLRPTLCFGPRPKTPDDMHYLVKRMGLRCFVNASTVPEREAYVGDYGSVFSVRVVDGRMSDRQRKSAPALLAHVRALNDHIGGSDRPCYVHAETGLADEAYIALVLWRLIAPSEAPADIEQWMKDNHKQALFDDDAEKRELLLECWRLLDAERERLDKMSFFGLPIKRYRPAKKVKTAGDQ